MNKKAFTLVELIVVITILAILATIGFVSFSGYLAETRDTNRVAQLKSMSDALELYRTKKSLPIPDDKVDVKSSGSVIAYQGYIGKNVLETIEYTESGLDPKDKNYFSYYLTKNKKYFQLLAFLEEENEDVVALNNFNKLNATDYSDRKPKTTGKKLGILTDTDNTPIQEIEDIKTNGLDIKTATGEYIGHFSDNYKLTGTGSKLMVIKNMNKIGGKILGSCKKILDQKSIAKGNNGIYIINPEGNNPFPVYCDMTTDGGGWTFFGHINSDSTGVDFFETGTGVYKSDRIDDGTKYSLGVDNFQHTEMMAILDQSDPIQANSENKIMFFNYKEGALGFNKGPIPCTGLGDGFSYKTQIGGSYISGGRTNICTAAGWYTRNNLNNNYLLLFYSHRGNYWGVAMGGNNSWDHDGWWYLR